MKVKCLWREDKKRDPQYVRRANEWLLMAMGRWSRCQSSYLCMCDLADRKITWVELAVAQTERRKDLETLERRKKAK